MSPKQQNNQPKKRARGLPRGRSRRVQQAPSINDDRLSPTRSDQSASINLSGRRQQDESTGLTDKQTLVTRKRKISSRDDTPGRGSGKCVPPSIYTGYLPPIALSLPKRVRFTSPTISPPLLSIFDQGDVQVEDDWETPLLPWAKDSTTFDLGDARIQCDPIDILQEPDWYIDEDRSGDDSSLSCEP
jgi:hypothetical protein